MSELKAGMTLVFTHYWEFQNFKGEMLSSYNKGDTILLLEETMVSPWGYIPGEGMSDPVFWVIRSKHGESTWTRIERLLLLGILELQNETSQA